MKKFFQNRPWIWLAYLIWGLLDLKFIDTMPVFWGCWCVYTFGAIFYYWPRHTIMRDGLPYITRVVLTGHDGRCAAPWPLSEVRANRFIHWIRSSDGPELHSHPWGKSTSLVLWGHLREVRALVWPSLDHRLVFSRRRGCRYTIYGYTFHRLEIVSGPVITYFKTTPKDRRWFFTDGKRYWSASGST